MLIAGVDEAGRGPLAGPVISAAVILDPKQGIKNLRDSKLLSEAQRQSLYVEICEKAIAWGVGRAEVEEIDELNILQATLLSMQRAVRTLKVSPYKILVDGNCCPFFEYPTEAIIGGDNLIPAISAASILAKVTRDNEMIQLDKEYPGFGFAKHKGYATEMHCSILRERGPCKIHRRSFSPVKEALKAFNISEIF